MRLIASAALLGMAFNAMAVSNEETVVPLHAQINKPCLSLRTDDFSRITLPAEALRVLADNRPAPPPNWQWLSEEDRLAYIAGNQARTLLVAARTAATTPEGCRELDLSAVPLMLTTSSQKCLNPAKPQSPLTAQAALPFVSSRPIRNAREALASRSTLPPMEHTCSS